MSEPISVHIQTNLLCGARANVQTDVLMAEGSNSSSCLQQAIFAREERRERGWGIHTGL